MLTIRNLSIRYSGLDVVSAFSLRLESGRIHTLIGPSGCGKSSLLKVLCGIHTNFSGSISYAAPFDQTGTPRVGPRIGYVPQQYGLLEWKTVRENIELPRRLGKHPGPSGTRNAPETMTARRKDMEAMDSVIETLGLTAVLDRYPRALSGGQRQRTALARAFALSPDLLLMDEPFSALDAFTADACMALFLSLWREKPVTALLITHNMHEAVRLGERLVIMRQGGRLLGVMDNPAFGVDDESVRAPVITALAARLQEALKEEDADG